jgi:hypothetical protein
MKYKKSVALVALAFTLALVSVALVQAKKPFRFEVEGVNEPYGWSAEITSGPFDGGTMYWYNHIAEFKGSRVYFFEEWEVWYEGTKVLAGYDKGVTRMKNGVFTGNGKVTYVDVDYPDYTYLIGYKEHVSGVVDFVTPNPSTWTFTATVQIN